MAKKKLLDIYDIRERTKETAPYFFAPETMRMWWQGMGDFTVELQPDGRYRISAPVRGEGGKYIKETVRYFNPENNHLERE